MEEPIAGAAWSAFVITEHARMRCQQRGKPVEAVTLVYLHGDVERWGGRGRRIVALSREASWRLVREGVAAATVERAARVEVVVSNADGALITVLNRAA